MTEAAHNQRDVDCVHCAVFTVSDSRTREMDTSGRLIIGLLERDGHLVASYEIIPDEPETIAARIAASCSDANIDAVLVTGGTGIAARDTTYEALASLLDKRLDGFGELFRLLSYEQVGAAAMLSRAIGGIRGTTVIFSMPGSSAAVELAMQKLILLQLRHIVGLLSR